MEASLFILGFCPCKFAQKILLLSVHLTAAMVCKSDLILNPEHSVMVEVCFRVGVLEVNIYVDL